MSIKRALFAVAASAAIVFSAVAQSPSRIVMGGKAIALVADAVFAFPGARPRIAAVAEADQGFGAFLASVYPRVAGLPPFDRLAGAEAYLAFNPDLVIMKNSLKTGIGAKLESLGVRTMYLSLETPEDWKADLEALGRVFGEESRAKELWSFYGETMDRAARAAAASRAAGRAAPRVLLAQVTGDGLELPPASWIQTRMVEMAGGVPVWKGAVPGSGWAKVGPEQVAAWDPDVVLIVSYRERSSAVAARIAADPRFSGLRAANTGRILGFPGDFLSWDQPDTRWGLGLLWLASTLNPGSMPGYSAEAEARRFFELFYDLSKPAFDAAILPKLGGIAP